MISYNKQIQHNAQLVIPMAGKSKRFYDAGYNSPKSLIDVFGEHILTHIVKNFDFISDVLVIVSVVGIENHTKGPSYSILMAQRFIKQELPILVHYCDVFANWNIGETFSTLQLSDAIFLSFKGFHPSRMNGTTYAYAKLEPGQQRRIQDIREKRSFTEDFEKEDASTGIYGFKSGELFGIYSGLTPFNGAVTRSVLVVFAFSTMFSCCVGARTIFRVCVKRPLSKLLSTVTTL